MGEHRLIEWKNGVRVMRDMTTAEIAEHLTPPPPEQIKAQMTAARAVAYASEADPLFFKWQAGESTAAVWKAKREEIRARYPYPE
jgi:hypothetical protein